MGGHLHSLEGSHPELKYWLREWFGNTGEHGYEDQMIRLELGVISYIVELHDGLWQRMMPAGILRRCTWVPIDTNL